MLRAQGDYCKGSSKNCVTWVHHEAGKDQMDQQKMFNQMVPNNSIVHSLKHSRSDRDHLAPLPICPWLTQSFRTSFQRAALLFPGTQKAPDNKSCKLWAHLHKDLWNLSESLKQKLYTHNTKNLCNYNSITTVCINSSWVRAISFIQMACTGRGYGGEQLAIWKQLPLLLCPQCHRPPGTQPVINSCASGMFVCGERQYRQQEFYFEGGHHL